MQWCPPEKIDSDWPRLYFEQPSVVSVSVSWHCPRQDLKFSLGFRNHMIREGSECPGTSQGSGSWNVEGSFPGVIPSILRRKQRGKIGHARRRNVQMANLGRPWGIQTLKSPQTACLHVGFNEARLKRAAARAFQSPPIKRPIPELPARHERGPRDVKPDMDGEALTWCALKSAPGSSLWCILLGC